MVSNTRNSCSGIVGTFLVVNLLLTADEGDGRGLARRLVSNNPDQVRFYLYSYPNSFELQTAHELNVNDLNTILRSGIRPDVPLKVLIHGFSHNYTCWFPQEVKDTYFTRGYRYNIIAVDWGLLATPRLQEPFLTFAYPLAVQNVVTAGNRISKLISLLRINNMIRLELVHVIGFSLGAHVSGIVGDNIQRQWRQKIGRITGLDPAGPLFYTGLAGRSLYKTDAAFVDIIHTDMGEKGHFAALGHADYYVNGGRPPQPGCDERDSSCSHTTAAKYFIQSIGRDDLRACRCPTWSSYKQGTCRCEVRANFGESARPGTNGAFFLNLRPARLSGRYTC